MTTINDNALDKRGKIFSVTTYLKTNSLNCHNDLILREETKKKKKLLVADIITINIKQY